MKKQRSRFAISLRLTAGESGCLSYMLTKETERLQAVLDRCEVCEVSAEMRGKLEEALKDLRSMRAKYDAAWEKIRIKARA